MLYSLLNLPADKLAQIQSIETEIGQPLLAFTEVRAAPARLDREKLEKIRKLEQDLGLVLVAVTDPEADDGAAKPRRVSRRR